jgi:hypothetical protein
MSADFIYSVRYLFVNGRKHVCICFPGPCARLIVQQHYWWKRLAERCFRLGDRDQVSQGNLSRTSGY